ncbi:MAG: response regulator [Syntrophobacteraceae bacterium]
MARLFVVDDEWHIRERLELELSEEGHEVITAASGHKLINKITVARPDLVILDIRLVDCDGLEMLLQIRDRYPDLPVIICSAYDSYKYDRRARAADYYVVKSYDLSQLKEKITRALDARIPELARAAG